MSKELLQYQTICSKIKGAEEGQLFGKPCFKINGKAFACFFEECMVFKLTDDLHELALGLKGSVLFDPSKKKRPMKEWVQVHFTHKAQWEKLAKGAFDYVKKSAK